MIVKDRAKNGQELQIVKEYNELTDDELKILVFKSGEKKKIIATISFNTTNEENCLELALIS